MENTLRFKTEGEFEADLGETWRHKVKDGWVYEMEYLFGKPCKPEWVGNGQLMYGKDYDLHHWNVSEDMVTDKPLP